MKGNKFKPYDNLENWFLNHPDDGSATDIEELRSRFKTIKVELLKIAREAEKGALLEEFKEKKEYVYLNDHGHDHIEEVLKNVTRLLNTGHINITLNQAYILLFSTYLHDCGNIHGRSNHEKKIKKIMVYLGIKAGHDNLEKRYVLGVASAHGGTVEGADDDKDTIAKLDNSSDYDLRLLASILRLADELSDRRGRESTYMMEMGEITHESEIYHQYSYSLFNVKFDEHTITLSYELSMDQIQKQFGKRKGECYLIDEIKERTFKVFREALYCCRFLSPSVDINKVLVDIKIFRDFKPDSLDIQPVKVINYYLKESGYPLEHENLENLFPELKKITGEEIKKELSQVEIHG
jgi:hypothetical protein